MHYINHVSILNCSLNIFALKSIIAKKVWADIELVLAFSLAQGLNQAKHTTGCLKKLFPLCVLSISQLPLLLKIKFISFLKSPFNGQFQNVQNLISRWKIHWEIHQDIHRIQNKNEQIWPYLWLYHGLFLTLQHFIDDNAIYPISSFRLVLLT